MHSADFWGAYLQQAWPLHFPKTGPWPGPQSFGGPDPRPAGPGPKHGSGVKTHLQQCLVMHFPGNLACCADWFRAQPLKAARLRSPGSLA